MVLIISRAESPATARRRSSGFPPTNSRQGSFVGQYARQWDSPRGSVSSPRGSISSATLPRSRLVSNIFVEVYQIFFSISRSPSAPHTMSPRASVPRVSGLAKLSTTSPLARDNSETNMASTPSKIRSQKVNI